MGEKSAWLNGEIVKRCIWSSQNALKLRERNTGYKFHKAIYGLN